MKPFIYIGSYSERKKIHLGLFLNGKRVRHISFLNIKKDWGSFEGVFEIKNYRFEGEILQVKTFRLLKVITEL